MNSLIRTLPVLALAAALLASPAKAESIYVLTNDNKVGSVQISSRMTVLNAVAITGIAAGETLVAIDVRPQNQQIYGLGVNATANTATLYHIAPETGFAAVVSSVAGTIAFTTDGATPVDFPDPATVPWDIDINPAADRIRVVAGSLSFRLNPNTGAAVDGDNGGGVTTGTNPDGPINGGTTTVDGAAYTNNQPNNANITTLYTLDPTSNSLFIQNPPNGGTQTIGQTVTLGGSTLDFVVKGFDIAPAVNAASSNTGVSSGSGLALLTVGGATSLYRINLVNAQATLIGDLDARSFAVRPEAVPVIAMTADGANLMRFSLNTPGTLTTQAIATGSLASGETLVAIDSRPQTGQMYALGVNAGNDTATLYLLDPQTGALTAVGTASQIAFTTNGVTVVDLPDPATTGYGMDFNPSVDRVRVVTGSGLNFRVNPITGAPVDGNNGGATTTGTNPDGGINGADLLGVQATAYTNSFGRDLAVAGPTTQYTLDSASDTLFIQNAPNAGTQTLPKTVTLNGARLDFTRVNGFDIPSTVAVQTSNTAAVGEGFLAATVGGVSGLYRVDLRSGEATLIGAIGTGSTSCGGLVVFAGPALENDDAATVAGGPTRVFVLANDGLSDQAVITGVSNSSIQVEGRSVIVPAGFSGTFTYTTYDHDMIGQGTVTITAGTPTVSPTTFAGLLRNNAGDLAGSAKVAISTKGVATVQMVGGVTKATTKITFPTGQTQASSFSSLGLATLVKNGDGTLSLTVSALGGTIGGVLLPARLTATAQKFHIALASADSSFPGGGYAIANVSKKGAVGIAGLLPDALTFSAAAVLRDDGTIAVYSVVKKGAKPPAIVGGELVAANLATTDVTGELAWLKLPQTKGIYLGGVDTVLNANGSLFTGLDPLPSGNSTLSLTDGNLLADETNSVAVSTKGVPDLVGSLKSWTGVSPKVGKFKVTLKPPGIPVTIKGSGLYLPKSNSAWGFFPGGTEGGTIQLTVP